MKHPSKLNTWATALFGVTMGLFVLFFLYVGFFERVSATSARPALGCRQVTEYSVEEYTSATSPTGFHKVYTWQLGQVSPGEECIHIYLVHHTARIYLDDALVFNLSTGAGSRICATPGSNWCSIPLYPADSGKTVGVVTEPAFSASAGRIPEFYLGSRYEMLRSLLSQDLLHIILVVCCILLGLFITVISVSMRFSGKVLSSDVFYLGAFSLLIGIWRITDLRVISFYLSGSTVMLSYITIGALCVCVIPLLLMFSRQFVGGYSKCTLWLSILASGTALTILALQIFGVAEFRQTLSLCHAMLILILVCVLAISAIRRIRRHGHREPQWHIALLCAGAVLDFARYYLSGTSSGVVFTIAAFILYTLIQFARSILETSTLAYTDPKTGLFNKFRWDVLMDQAFASGSDVGMMMLDLNRLKHINDTLGHDAGDLLIFNFANILRHTLPPNCIICRWGGDEFTVLITDANRERMEQYIQNLHAAADGYNRQAQGPAISFAAGFALSSEHPGLTGTELLRQADEAMYRDKRAWYAENPLPR